jgi:hypothetical protein
MQEVWSGQPTVGPHGEILDIDPNNRFGVASMIKVDTEAIGARTLLGMLGNARLLGQTNPDKELEKPEN